jgi:hypothetical protein
MNRNHNRADILGTAWAISCALVLLYQILVPR